MNFISITRSTMRLERFDLLRFPLMVLVVYVHALGSKVGFADGSSVSAGNPLTDRIEVAISHLLGGAAVPLFFLMSAFLLFRSFTPTLAGYLDKLKSRARTLLIPYLFWNTALLAAVAVAEHLPATAPFFIHGTPPFESPLQYLSTVYGGQTYPFAFQFWFIRDLMLLVVAAPLVYLAVRWAGPPLIAALAVLWVSGTWVSFPPDVESVLFFTLGAWLAVKRVDPFAIDRFWPAIAGTTAALLLAALLAQGSVFAAPAGHIASAGVIAVLLCLSGAALESPRWRAALLALAPASFIVFALHEPLQSILRKLIYRFVPVSDLGAFAIYLLVPVLVIAVTIGVHALLRRHAPKMLAVVTGGR